MDLPGQPGDALAQSTRARLFSALAEEPRAMSTDELARSVGLHPNGVRVHLERLRSAGLVVRERQQRGRGRPRDVWLVAPGAQPGGSAPRSYAELSRWLTRALTTGDVESTGRDIGHELVADPTANPQDGLRAAFAALGFAPHVESGDPLRVRLDNCPYRDAVRENPDVVCCLHRGITRGLLDQIAPNATLTAFVPQDPDTAGCMVEIQGA